MNSYEFTDSQGRPHAVVEAENKHRALAGAQKAMGGSVQASAFVSYLLHPKHGPLHARRLR